MKTGTKVRITAVAAIVGTTLSGIAQPLETRPPQQLNPLGSEPGPFIVAGAGNEKCSKLNAEGKAGRPPQMFESPATIMIFGWVQGYLSGLNMGSVAGRTESNPSRGYFDLASISPEEQWAFVTVYCQRNPDSRSMALQSN